MILIAKLSHECGEGGNSKLQNSEAIDLKSDDV